MDIAKKHILQVMKTPSDNSMWKGNVEFVEKAVEEVKNDVGLEQNKVNEESTKLFLLGDVEYIAEINTDENEKMLYDIMIIITV